MNGFISRVLSFSRALRDGTSIGDVKVSRPEVLTLEHLSAPGDDSPPLPTDYAGGFNVDGTGRAVAAGYSDSKNPGIAEPGERRLYGRDASGDVVSSVHFRNDGSVQLVNANGSFSLAADGSWAMANPEASIALDASGRLEMDVRTFKVGNGAGVMELDAGGAWNVNGVTIDAAGNIDSGGDVSTALGVSLQTHVHVGSPSAPTGGVTPTGVPIP